jgi:sulfatase maturation enzyme AslB (radical SAM superfamily)
MCSHSQSAGTGNTLLSNSDKILTIHDLDDYDVINCTTLKAVRKTMLDGQWPEQCQRCKDESAVGGNSRDKWETARHADSFTYDMALKLTDQDGKVNDTGFMDFDLRIGNQCNLRCVMCFPGEASKWYDSYENITDNDHFVVDNHIYDLKTSKNAFSWSRDKSNIDALIRKSKQLLKIKFGGGEPLLIKHHRYLLESLISAGYAGRMELEYSSNLTIFPPDLFTIWENFKQIRICASIDAYGIANDAIRYHSDWKAVTDNLHMLDNTKDNISVFLSTTISNLSLEHYGSLLLWAQQQRFKKIKEHASHLVYNPKHFSISILEKKHLDRMISKSKDAISDNARLVKRVQYYENLYNEVAMEDRDAIEHRISFVKIFDRLSIDQKQEWYDIFPIAAEVVNEWKDRYNV